MNVKIMGISILLVGLWIYMGISVPEAFFKGDNIYNLLLRTAMYGVLGIGVAFVIITAGIDLSIGSVVCLSGCLITILLKVDYMPLESEKVIAIDPEQQLIVLSEESEQFNPGDTLRYFGGTRARSALVTLSTLENTKILDDDNQLSKTASLLRVEGLDSNSSRDRGGTVAKVFLVKQVNVKESTLLVAGEHEELAARDKVEFFNPKGGMGAIVVADAETKDGNTLIRFSGDIGAVSEGWLAMPLDRHQRMPVPLALLTVLAFALVLGLVHGLLVTKVKLQPFVVTLCGLLLYRGISRWSVKFSVGVPDMDTGLKDEYESSLTPLTEGKLILWTVEGGSPYAIPYAFFIFAFVAILAAIFLNKTIWGRYMLALGRNVEAARFSGINTDRMVIIGYVICTAMAALGGLFFLVYANTISPSKHGNFHELYAIAAAVLGGCSLRGGEGSILGVVIGTALMVTLKMFITLMKISDALEFVILGAVILVGVIADEMLKRAMARKKAIQG